jgi:hypothetical protein
MTMHKILTNLVSRALNTATLSPNNRALERSEADLMQSPPEAFARGP